MSKIGYARVSTKDQNLARQVRMLNDTGCDELFREKASGSSRVGRPELENAINALKEGDTLVIAEWDRATRSMIDGIDIMLRIHAMKCHIMILDKPYLDTTTPMGQGILALLSAMAEDERIRIVKRAADGLAAAKERGQRLGRPDSLTPEQKEEARKMVALGEKNLSAIGAIFGVSGSTISRLSA